MPWGRAGSERRRGVMKYDTGEAARIFAGLSQPTLATLTTAAGEVLDAVLAAAEEAGLTGERVDEGVYIDDPAYENHRAGLKYSQARFWASPPTQGGDERDWARVDGVEFDPLKKQFVGLSVDTFRLPVPGQPQQRRSAVAVLVEVLVARFPTD
jgi:hypothetical protein